MYKFKIVFLFFIVIFNSFAKELTINFNVPRGSIKYYKAGDKDAQTFDFFQGQAKLDVKKGNYTFFFSAPEYAPIFKEIDTKNIRELNIDFSKENTVVVNGTVKSNEMNIGGAEVQFIDSENRGYTFSSDFLGRFTAYLPKGNYRIKANKFGYMADRKNALVYEFYSSTVPYNISINLTEIPSFIEGRVIDDRGNPVIDADITIKNGTETYHLKADEFGKFRQTVEAGIVTLICNKSGFIQNGAIRKIDSQSSITNLEIILTKTKFNIQGVVTDGVKALANIPISIHDEDINRIATVVSNETGYYEFNNIEGDKDVYISVADPSYKRYRTELFRLDRNINDFNLILEKN